MTTYPSYKGDVAAALLHAREPATLYPMNMQLRFLILDLEQHQVR